VRCSIKYECMREWKVTIAVEKAGRERKERRSILADEWKGKKVACSIRKRA